MKEESKEKVERIQQLVKEDMSNGRSIQRKIKLKIKKKGESPEAIAEELKHFSHGE